MPWGTAPTSAAAALSDTNKAKGSKQASAEGSKPSGAASSSTTIMTRTTTTTTAALSLDVDPTATSSSMSVAPEEGQEALWIEVEPDSTASPSPRNKNGASGDGHKQRIVSATNAPNNKAVATLGGAGAGVGAGAEGNPTTARPSGFRFPSPLRTVHRKQHPPAQGEGVANNSNKKSHVLLMDPQHTVVTTRLGQPKETPDDIQRLAIHKAQQARQLLKQAASQSDPKRRVEWAQSAFATALEARLLVEPSVTDDLQQLLQSVCQSGIAAASRPRDMSEAFMCLGQLIDCVGSATTTAPITGAPNGDDMDGDISTLGFDNTFELPTPRGTVAGFGADTPRRMSNLAASPGHRAVAAAVDRADVMSVSSLNEILDAPMDTNVKNEAPAADRPTPVGDGATGAKTRPPLFGALRKSTATANVAAPRESAAKSGRGWRRKDKKVSKSKGVGESSGTEPARRNGRFVQKFKATVVAEDDSDPEDDELHPTVEELRAREIDLRLQAKLQEALQNDGTESITSLHGVPLHGMDVTKSKKTKDKNKSKHVAKKSAAADVKSTPVAPPAASSNIKPQVFDRVKPKFTAAPRGEPHILMQKSWESLEEGGALDGAPVLRVTDLPPPPPPPPPPRLPPGKVRRMPHMDDTEVDPLVVVPVPSTSPTSSVGDDADAEILDGRRRRGDKYRVDPAAQGGTDRYALAETESDVGEDGLGNVGSHNRTTKTSCPPFLESCMDAVRHPRSSQETSANSIKSMEDEDEVGDEQRYVPVNIVEEGELEAPVVLKAAETSRKNLEPPKKGGKWKLSLFGRNGRKDQTAVVVPPLPSEDVSTGSRPAPAKGQSQKQAPKMKSKSRGRSLQRTVPQRPAPIVAREAQSLNSVAPKTPQQYATVVSPPPLPSIGRPFSAFRSTRPASTADVQGPAGADPARRSTALPAWNAKSPSGNTTTAVEQLVRTMSKQGSVPMAMTSSTHAASSAEVSMTTATRAPAYVPPVSVHNNGNAQGPAHNAEPVVKPTSPSFFGSRLGPFGGGKGSNGSGKKAKPREATMTTTAMNVVRPPTAPLPAVATTVPTKDLAPSTSNVPSVPTKTDAIVNSAISVATGGIDDSRDDDYAERPSDELPPTLTADTTADDSAMTEDSLVHLIKEQQKKKGTKGTATVSSPSTKPANVSSPSERFRRGRGRGLEPVDRDSVLANGRDANSNRPSRGIDP